MYFEPFTLCELLRGILTASFERLYIRVKFLFHNEEANSVSWSIIHQNHPKNWFRAYLLLIYRKEAVSSNASMLCQIAALF
jgi:hypothetical protein